MIEVNLWSRDGRPVERVLIPPFDPSEEPELLAWGARFFILHSAGDYREVPCLQAYTEREHGAMARGGGG